jgi:hypothetical protein
MRSNPMKRLFPNFCRKLGESDLAELSTEQILNFLNGLTEGRKPQIKRTRFSHLTAFFNFIKANVDPTF